MEKISKIDEVVRREGKGRAGTKITRIESKNTVPRTHTKDSKRTLRRVISPQVEPSVGMNPKPSHSADEPGWGRRRQRSFRGSEPGGADTRGSPGETRLQGDQTNILKRTWRQLFPST